MASVTRHPGFTRSPATVVDGLGTVGGIELVATTDPSADVADVAGGPDLGSRRAVLLAAGLVAVVVGVVRWWIARSQRVFALIPDEAATLAMARTLAGDRWDMFDASTFRPGFSILIAPIWWFATDPSTGLAAVWVVNAALGGLSAGLYVVAARRLTDLGVVGSALAAAAVALSPAILFTTRYAWAEALVQPVVVGFVLALLAFGDRPTVGRGVVMVGAAALGFAVHSRLLALSFVALGLVAVLVGRGRMTARAAAGVAAVAAGGLALASLGAATVVERTWTDPSPTNSFGGAVGQWRQIGSMLATATGQVWYQLVASLGLAALGAWSLLRPTPHARTGRRDGVLVVATVLALLALSIAFLAGRERPDRLVYGRYTDPASALLVPVGLAAIVRHRARAARRLVVLATMTLAVAVALVALRGEELRVEGAVRAMILGLQPVAGYGTTVPVGPATAVAVAAMAVFAVINRAPRAWRSTLLVAGLVVALVVADARVRDRTGRSLNARLDAADVTRVVAGDDPILPPGAAVRVRVGESALVGREGFRQRIQLYQFFLPGHRFEPDGTESVETPYVFAPADDPGLAATAGAGRLWEEPGTPVALWYVPTG